MLDIFAAIITDFHYNQKIRLMLQLFQFLLLKKIHNKIFYTG